MDQLCISTTDALSRRRDLLIYFAIIEILPVAFFSFRDCRYQGSTPYFRASSCGLLQQPKAESSDGMRLLGETGETISWGERIENDARCAGRATWIAKPFCQFSTEKNLQKFRYVIPIIPLDSTVDSLVD